MKGSYKEEAQSAFESDRTHNLLLNVALIGSVVEVKGDRTSRRSRGRDANKFVLFGTIASPLHTIHLHLGSKFDTRHTVTCRLWRTKSAMSHRSMSHSRQLTSVLADEELSAAEITQGVLRGPLVVLAFECAWRVALLVLDVGPLAAIDSEPHATVGESRAAS